MTGRGLHRGNFRKKRPSMFLGMFEIKHRHTPYSTTSIPYTLT